MVRRPKSEKLSEEPGVHAQEVEKESAVSSGRKRLTKREHAGRNALPDHLPRREESSPWRARNGSVCAAERRVAASATRKRRFLTWNWPRYFVRVITREKLACRKCPKGEFHGCSRRPQDREKRKLSDAVVVDVLIKKIPLPSASTRRPAEDHPD